MALRASARGADRAIVIGGGLIGAEIACALTARGLGVTLIAREAWLWGHLAPEVVGRAVGRTLMERGIDLQPSRIVVAVRNSVQPSRSQMRSETGSFHSIERPKSPRKTMPEIHFQYWT